MYTQSPLSFFFPLAEFLCAAMVASVSPDCIKTKLSIFSSSVPRLHTMEFAIAVMDTVNSREFILLHPCVIL